VTELDKVGLIPIPDAAARLGIDVKRLRGYVHRNGIGDPVGSLETDEVYGWSLVALEKRLTDREDV